MSVYRVLCHFGDVQVLTQVSKTEHLKHDQELAGTWLAPDAPHCCARQQIRRAAWLGDRPAKQRVHSLSQLSIQGTLCVSTKAENISACLQPSVLRGQ